MSDNTIDVLDKYFKRPKPDVEDEDTDSYKAYGILRVGGRLALSLDVRRYNGDRLGLEYAYLMKVRFNPSEGITLYFTSATVTLAGWNLHPVYDGLLRHAVLYVQEGNRNYDKPADKDTFIEKITVIEAE